MSQINQGGFVYPHSITEEFDSGITRRDWLAGLAMQGMLSNTSEDTQDAKAEFLAIATLSYRMADTMIAESEKDS